MAATLLGALLRGSFKERVTGELLTAAANDLYSERFIELRWDGIGTSS